MAAAVDDEVEAVVDLRARIVALGGEVASALATSRRASASAHSLIGAVCAITRADSRSKISSSSPSARSAALAILASSSPSSVVVKRTWPASVWRWMKVALSGAAMQLVAVLGGHLDEIAEHVVVADFQRRACRSLRRSAPARRRPRGAIRRASARVSSSAGVVAFAHEAAVALEGGQFGGERGGQLGGQHAVRAAAGLQRVGDFGRRILERRQSAGEIGGRQHAVADGGEIARAAAADGQARQRAREIGRRLQAASAYRRAPRRRRRSSPPRRAAARSPADR